MTPTQRRILSIAIEFPAETSEACAQLILSYHRLLCGKAMAWQAQPISRGAQRLYVFEQRTPIDT